MKKNLVYISLILFISIALVGCGQVSSGKSNDSKTETDSNTTAEATTKEDTGTESKVEVLDDKIVVKDEESTLEFTYSGDEVTGVTMILTFENLTDEDVSNYQVQYKEEGCTVTRDGNNLLVKFGDSFVKSQFGDISVQELINQYKNQ